MHMQRTATHHLHASRKGDGPGLALDKVDGPAVGRDRTIVG